MARLAARATVPTMSEADFLRAVLDLITLFGHLVHHCRPARTSRGWVTPIQGHAGFVDLVIAGLGGVPVPGVEDRHRPYHCPATHDWLGRLNTAGQDADIWRPEDLRSGRIERELRALRIPRGDPS